MTMQLLTVKLPDRLHALFKRHAERKGCTMSDLVRRHIAKAVRCSRPGRSVKRG